MTVVSPRVQYVDQALVLRLAGLNLEAVNLAVVCGAGQLSPFAARRPPSLGVRGDLLLSGPAHVRSVFGWPSGRMPAPPSC
jgi:hypothetical protein